MSLNDLILKYGFSLIPWSEMRSCPCPKCKKKTLAYANHPHAQGYKDTNRIRCRSCGKVFTLVAKTD